MELSAVKARKSPPWLWGKHLLITGGSSGIGREVAVRLMGTCARLTVVARNQDGNLQRLERDLCRSMSRQSLMRRPRLNTQVGLYAMDVRDIEAARALIERLYDAPGQVDAFLNCAGGSRACALLEHMCGDDIDEIFDVNGKAPIFWLRELLPRMKSNRASDNGNKLAHVVMLSSRSGERGLPQLSVYAAAKASIERLIEAVRAEYASARVAFTVVCPGAIDTRFTRHWSAERQMSYRAMSMPLADAVQPIVDALNAQFAVNRISYESVEQWLGEPGVLKRE